MKYPYLYTFSQGLFFIKYNPLLLPSWTQHLYELDRGFSLYWIGNVVDVNFKQSCIFNNELCIAFQSNEGQLTQVDVPFYSGPEDVAKRHILMVPLRILADDKQFLSWPLG